MWSGFLPPGVNESDVDLSSDDGDAADGPALCTKDDREEAVKRIQVSDFQIDGPESTSVSVTDEENACQPCPSGISLNMWNKFLELQKKKCEMKAQANERKKGKKRKRSRKEKLKKNDKEVTDSQQLTNEDQWKELTQYFGNNDRFEPLVSKKAPQKLALNITWTLHSAIEATLPEKGVIKGFKLGVKIAKAVACRNFVKAKQETEASQEARKKKKLAWGFEAKKRWETKSNMGYM
ncbi:PREDICTED: protein FAM204A [Crocodylus porosus]|uniref:protein FAM204A n=1 Tax=Crocodylus porosus TaxID=8502 RepID=UPI0009399D20|nr:PREDICTED: protein FAM204A [Crocodylus porosus]